MEQQHTQQEDRAATNAALPALETAAGVPAVPAAHGSEASALPPGAEAAASAPAPQDLSIEKDQLRRAFSGDALAQLEELGVSAFNSADVERNVLGDALEEGEIEEVPAPGKATDGAAAADNAASAAAAAAPARKRVPKKSAARLELESERSSFIPLPVVRPRERVVHPMERPAAKAHKPFRSTGVGVGSGATTGRSVAGSLISRRADGDSVMERALQSRTLKDADGDAARDRQRRVEAGEITPFMASSLTGLEKGFQRVATQRIAPLDTTTVTAAASPAPAAAAAARPTNPSLTYNPFAAPPAASSSNRALPVNVSAYSSPFPSRPAPHESLSQLQKQPSKAKQASSAKSKPVLSRAATAAAKPSLKKPVPAKRARSSAKRVKREPSSSASEDDEEEDEEDVFGDSASSARRKVASKPVQRWQCEACTYINPSDFSKRCDMCHSVRTNFDPMPLPAASAAAPLLSPDPAVKSEPIDVDALDSDGEAVLYKPAGAAAASESNGGAARKPRQRQQQQGTKRKRYVKSEGDEAEEGEAGADDAAEEEEEEEWQADNAAAESTTEESEEEEDEEDKDMVDRALRTEDGVHDSDDDDEDELERLALEEEEEDGGRRAGGGRGSRRARPLHDDYEQWRYDERVRAWREHRDNEARLKKLQREMRAQSDDPAVTAAAAAAGDDDEELDVAFEGGYILPSFLWNKLFAYQKTCIKWLWELHAQNVGGIIADEMGLGKTIQVISFLAGLHYSVQNAAVGADDRRAGIGSPLSSLGPTLLVVPATILAQWMREFHEWYPEMRVLVLHDSVSHGPAAVSRARLVQRVFEQHDEGGGQGTVLVTTYQSLASCKHLLLPREWGYVILDEGHKVRSPDARITLLCKQLLSVHRLVLTGSPIQNSLTELWSLFDFVFPGKLGTLPVFEDEFASPITIGGYTSASPVQVALAYKCALILRDLVNPYILRRQKADVAQHLPPKTEQVLFCNLTPEQHQVYRDFLDTNARDIGQIVAGRLSLFRVIHYLRKICNHPDLLQLQPVSVKKGKDGRAAKRQQALSADYGAVSRSGKLLVLRQVLRMWHEQGHRCLVFSQTRQMLDILESFVRSEKYTYARVDGTTSIAKRLPIIDDFNHRNDVFVMLLTTRAGGLGVNLTGADRVILFDPDWNPSSDKQSSERAYRIGQGRPVTVYRLVTRSAIEEKVYHRQIWKQFLTDKILRDPKQKRFFSNHDIKDLFSLGPLPKAKGAAGQARTNALGGDAPGPSETATIFQQSGGEIRAKDVLRAAEEERRQEEERRRFEQAQFKQQQAAASRAVQLEEGEVAPEEDVKMAPAETAQSVFFPPAAAAVSSVGAGPLQSTPRKASRPPSQPGTPAVKLEASASVASASPDIPMQIESAAYESDPEDRSSRRRGHHERERDHHAQSAADDNRILAQLFTSGGLQSAMSHDRILSSSSQEEAHIVANLAHKKAAKAVQALKTSRQQMRDQPVNAPTWTGRNGISGAPSFVINAALGGGSASSAAKPRFGSSSRKPTTSSAAAAAGAVSALTDSAVKGGKLRAASFAEPAATVAAAAAPGSAARHFDSSVSGFALTATTAPASLATRSLNTGGAAPSSTLLQRMRARSHVTSAMASHTGMLDSALMDLDGTPVSSSSSTAAGGLSGSVLHDPSLVSVGSSATSAAHSSDALAHALREKLAAARSDGGIPSAELISAFEAQVGTSEADKLVFRELLRSMAQLTGPKKHRRWTLKDEFR